MKLRRTVSVLVALAFAVAAWADTFPQYYPKEGFQRTGTIDSVQLQAQRIIIDDVPYAVSSNLIVHALNAYSVPVSRLEKGRRVGYKISAGRMITRIWLLPADYEDPRWRR